MYTVSLESYWCNCLHLSFIYIVKAKSYKYNTDLRPPMHFQNSQFIPAVLRPSMHSWDSRCGSNGSVSCFLLIPLTIYFKFLINLTVTICLEDSTWTFIVSANSDFITKDRFEIVFLLLWGIFFQATKNNNI